MTLSLIAGIAAAIAVDRTVAQTSVQVVNATSVPEIALRVNGRLDYPKFPQGRMTADAAAEVQRLVYEVEDPRSGKRVKSPELRCKAGEYQSMVILGDFSTGTPPGGLPQPAQLPADRKFPPNIVFRLFPHSEESADSGLRLRIINGMPGRKLVFSAGKHRNVLLPGEDLVIPQQPSTREYVATVDDRMLRILMRQENNLRNAMVIFYLREDGSPGFTRAFENTARSRALNAAAWERDNVAQ